MADANRPSPPLKFESVEQIDVPKGRAGKHKTIISELLSDLDQLESGRALRIPLAELPDTKENIRSALNRAAHQHDLVLATSSDTHYLYIWKNGTA